MGLRIWLLLDSAFFSKIKNSSQSVTVKNLKKKFEMQGVTQLLKYPWELFGKSVRLSYVVDLWPHNMTVRNQRKIFVVFVLTF